MVESNSGSVNTVPLKTEDFLNRKCVALVIWDMQKGLAGRTAEIDKITKAAKALISAADHAKIPVIWSCHILPSLELIPRPFLLFLMKKQKVEHPRLLAPTMQHGMNEAEFIAGLAPAHQHIVVEKSQPSLFVDTPVDLRLKAMGRDTIVVAGVATGTSEWSSPVDMLQPLATTVSLLRMQLLHTRVKRMKAVSIF